MTRPRTGSELSTGEKLRGVLHRLQSGAAHKPEAIVRLPVVQDPINTAYLDPSNAVPNRPMIQKMDRMTVNATARNWIDVVKKIAHDAKVQTSDLWALISCTGAGQPVFISIRIRNDILSFCNQENGDGAMRCFLRMDDLVVAIVDDETSQLAFGGTYVSYVTRGRRVEVPFAPSMENTVVQPVPPPDSGYEEMRGLGSAITEAVRFAKPEIDYLALNAVHVKPLQDGTGNAEVVALSSAIGYRRTTHQPKLKQPLVIVPNWLFRQPRLVGANLGVKFADFDFVWFITSKGVVAGIDMTTDLPFAANYMTYFTALDGRLDFTVDEVRAMRRAIEEVGQINPMEREIGIRSDGRRLILRGKETAEVSCHGDVMDEIIVDPHLLTEALKVRGILSLEFAKEDPEHNLHLVGRDVEISLMPCRQRSS